MFTIKLYRDGGYRQKILEADSFTILRYEDGSAEITLHRRPGPKGEYLDERHDIVDLAGGPELAQPPGPQRWERAIIENAQGKTTEIVDINAAPRKAA